MRILCARPKRTGSARVGRKRDRRTLLGWLVLAASVAFFLLITALLCRPLVRLASNPREMRAFVLAQGGFGRAAFLGMEILQGFLPVPLELTAVAGGYIFGKTQGFLLSVCSVPVSSAVIFRLTKMFGHGLADRLIPPMRQNRARWFRNAKVRDAVTFFVFFIPGTPKRLFVLTAGLVPQSFRRFLVLSTAARVPALFACSFSGGALGSGDYILAVFLLVLIGGLALAGSLFYRRVAGPRSAVPPAGKRLGKR
ncbi:MAG: VTT domain-containing protein [Oscillospiraceae bacterium]|jgi:uncharacterized membrane protein YdjX (TVP38/TMEM64 family)|nr:VTT domain-containing protein [Oscillospiraceae bacterium]MCI1989865.1 VTT domain-containing protein [Oscillospiraceae bacterium]MCI2034910.1 VTT domain-containing protein [Oscillospiraceae bacterium]